LVVVVEEVEWSGGEENSKLLCRNSKFDIFLSTKFIFFKKDERKAHALKLIELKLFLFLSIIMVTYHMHTTLSSATCRATVHITHRGKSWHTERDRSTHTQ